MSQSLLAYATERRIAVSAVQTAARLCQRVRSSQPQQRDLAAAMTKSDASPVTVADYGAQAIICRALARAPQSSYKTRARVKYVDAQSTSPCPRQ